MAWASCFPHYWLFHILSSFKLNTGYLRETEFFRHIDDCIIPKRSGRKVHMILGRKRNVKTLVS